MKKLLLIIFFFISVTIYSEEITILEIKNIYGGQTIERKFTEQEQRIVNYPKLVEYYNNKNAIVKIIISSAYDVAVNTGIKEQVQYYENGKIIQYEMFFTDEYVNIHGFNRLTEDVNSEGKIILTKWYDNNVLLDIARGSENKFQFFNIEFIESEFLDGYEQEESKDVFGLSAKYVSLRSVIKFDTKLIDLDNNDFILMRYFALSRGFNDISNLYSKKVKVFSQNNRSYWLFVQTELVQHVKGHNATIMYYPITRNGELFLLCVGFYDIK